MKHLFRVYSFTTYLVAKLIIQNKQIEKNDYIFLLERNFKPNDEDVTNSYYYPNWVGDPYCTFKARKHFYKCWPIKRKFDEFIKNLVSENNFVYYTYNLSIPTNQLIQSHPLCNSVNIMEEGMDCYTSKIYEPVKIENWRKKILLYLSYYGRLSRPRYLLNEATLFSLTNLAFPDRESVNVFNHAEISRILGERGGCQIPPNSVIIPFDAVIHTGEMEKNDFIEIYSHCINYFLKLNKNIFVKFHPIQTEAEKNNIKSIFPEIDRLKYLSDQCSIEKFIFDDQEYIFVGLISSLLFYAAINGNKSFTLSKKAKINPQIEIPSEFFKYVKDFYSCKNEISGKVDYQR